MTSQYFDIFIFPLPLFIVKLQSLVKTSVLGLGVEFALPLSQQQEQEQQQQQQEPPPKSMRRKCIRSLKYVT